jgi:hypothetical protein
MGKNQAPCSVGERVFFQDWGKKLKISQLEIVWNLEYTRLCGNISPDESFGTRNSSVCQDFFIIRLYVTGLSL